MVGEVTVTLPAIQQNTVPRNADSGIELDSLSTLTPAAGKTSLRSTCDTIDMPSIKKTPRRSHQRSLSSDFFRDSKSTPVVTCVHRKNPCGRVCGHRRALSSDFRLDKVLPLDECKDERIKPIKRVLFGHRRNPSNTSQASIGKCYALGDVVMILYSSFVNHEYKVYTVALLDCFLQNAFRIIFGRFCWFLC